MIKYLLPLCFMLCLGEAYQLREGDIWFQSLYKNPVVKAIEGSTKSPYSHCGILVQRKGKWEVLEAIGPVKYTPLMDWIFQSRDSQSYIYRLSSPQDKHIPGMIKKAELFLGRPYDIRYRLDDEKIYCSELIYKAFKKQSGIELGKLQRLGSLNWIPYTFTILALEKGGLPLFRQMITPRSLSEAKELNFLGTLDGNLINLNHLHNNSIPLEAFTLAPDDNKNGK